MVDGFDNHDPTRALAVGSTWLRSRERVGHGALDAALEATGRLRHDRRRTAARRDSVDYPV